MQNDEEIMMAVAGGDLRKLSVLFDRYHIRLYNFFYKMNYDQALSEDLTQNVFERMIKYKTSFDGNNAFIPWMFRIARNVNADHYKSVKIKISDNVEVQQLDRPEETTDDLDSKKLILKRAMLKLSDDYREILLMTRFQGLKYTEVAEVLQCSESNIKTRVHRAIKALRKEYLKIETIN